LLLVPDSYWPRRSRCRPTTSVWFSSDVKANPAFERTRRQAPSFSSMSARRAAQLGRWATRAPLHFTESIHGR
jgi:hypothetical protein